MQNESRTAPNLAVTESRPFVAPGLRVTLRQPRPYPLASLALAVYVATIVILSKNPELFNLSHYIGFGLSGIFAFEFVVNRERLWFPREFTSFGLFLALMVVGALWSPLPEGAITLSLTFFQLLVFGVIATNIMVARGSIKPLVLGMLVGLLWAVFVAVDEQNFRFMAAASYTRVASVLYNANLYSINLLIGCMFAWYLFEGSKKKGVRIVLIVLILLFLHQIIFYSGSRKGILAIFLVYPVFLFLQQIFQSESSLQRVFGMILLIATFYVVGWQVVGYSVFFSRVANSLLEITKGTRGQMIRFALDLWRDSPLLGQGTNQFRMISPWRTYSHSNYPELLANNGLVGILVFYSFFAVLARKYLRLFRSGYLTTTGVSWLLSFVFLLLFLDVAMVSYYVKAIWLAYTSLVALSYIPQAGGDFSSRTRPGAQPHLTSAANRASGRTLPGGWGQPYGRL